MWFTDLISKFVDFLYKIVISFLGYRSEMALHKKQLREKCLYIDESGNAYFTTAKIHNKINMIEPIGIGKNFVNKGHLFMNGFPLYLCASNYVATLLPHKEIKLRKHTKNHNLSLGKKYVWDLECESDFFQRIVCDLNDNIFSLIWRKTPKGELIMAMLGGLCIGMFFTMLINAIF